MNRQVEVVIDSAQAGQGVAVSIMNIISLSVVTGLLAPLQPTLSIFFLLGALRLDIQRWHEPHTKVGTTVD